MIIYQDTKAGFVDDIANNYFVARLEDAFIKKTGSLPADSRGWANDYARFCSTVLGPAKVADDIQVAIEYYCSPVGRYRIDVLLVGSDGNQDHALIIELKAWDTAQASDVENMVMCPIGGGTLKQHPNLQACKYKGIILDFNADIAKNDVTLHPSTFLFNLYRREPEPLEDPRYKEILSQSRLFMADDVTQFKTYLEELVPKKDALIHVIRGQRVMLDRDLAELYGVETKALNQAVRRHANRFPPDFMFQTTPLEMARLRSQIVTSKSGRGGQRYLSNVFTEQGVSMLSSVLNSERAVEINIAIMRAFVKLRQALMIDAGLANRMEKAEQALEAIESEQGEHAVAIHEILAAMRTPPRRRK